MTDFVKLTLDIRKRGVQDTINLTAGDSNSRGVIISLVADGSPFDIPTEAHVALRIEPDYSLPSEIIDGKITHTFSLPVFSDPGEYLCEVKIYSENGTVLYSPKFAVVANEKLFDGDGELPDGGISDVEKLIIDTNDAKNRANSAADSAEEAVGAANEAVTNALAALENANAATESVNLAIENADEAAQTAKEEADNAEKMADKAEASALQADEAAKKANDQADKVSGMLEAGELNGGYYVPSVTQAEVDRVYFRFEPTQEGMEEVAPVRVSLPQGPQGKSGKDGYTPIKGVDYFDGKDGVPVTHSWEGTTLTITSASGTSSADLKGDPGITPEIPAKIYKKLGKYNFGGITTFAFDKPLERLFIKLESSGSISGIDMYGRRGTTDIAKSGLPAQTATGAKYACCEMFVDCGYWRGSASGWKTGTSNVSTRANGDDYVRFMKHSFTSYPGLTSLKLTSAFPEGTTAEIFGIEVDANTVATLEELDL